MIAVTYNAANAWLLNDEPNWLANVTVEAQIPVSNERGLTGRETRRATGDTLRLALKWRATVNGAPAVTTLRNALETMAAEPVLCPFWPGLTAAGLPPACSTAYYVLLDDTAAPSIQPAGNAPFARTSYPLLVGYLPTLPAPELLNDTLATVEFDFEENDASSLTPAVFNPANALVDGSGAARPLFPFPAEWTNQPASGEAEYDITRQPIGAQRALQVQYFAQPNRRKVKQAFTLQNGDGLNLLRFFFDRSGQTQNFWLPASLSEAALTVNVGAADTTLTVDNPAALGTNVFIALNDNCHIAALKVTGVAGNVWTVSAAPGVAFTAANTRIESLILARFDTLKLTLVFESPILAKATVGFKEVPWEPSAVAGETIGATMGALPPTAMLFKFTLTVPSANQTWYLTGFERNLSDGVNNWLTAPMECSAIAESDSLEKQSVTIKSTGAFANNPLALLFPFQLEFPLLVQIYEGDVTGNNVGNLRCYFSGQVSRVPTMKRPFISAECNSLNKIFDRNIPRQLFQPGCNWVLFESNCGLLPANWKWTAVVVSYNAATSTLVLGTIASTNTATVVAHYFGAGYVQITTAGNRQTRMVSDNTVIAGGQMSVYLSQPLFTAPSAGDAVALYPGCSGRYAEDCTAKFNNAGQFGGFPFMPVNNPTVFKLANNGSGGKK